MRLDYPATARNRDPILGVLGELVLPGARVLEIASGSGQHAVFLAPRLEVAFWQPSDPSASARKSIDAWRTEAPLVRPALDLDVLGEWPLVGVDVIVCINMVHISPWSCTLALLDGASPLLPPSGLLYLYGPYRRDGAPTAASNEAFDRSLRSRDPEWGLRRVEALAEEARLRGLRLDRVVEMPANNLSLSFVKDKSSKTD